MMQPHAKRWRSLAGAGVLVLGAAVVGLAYNKKQVHTTASPRTSGANLVGVVVTPSDSTPEKTIQIPPRPFPKVALPAPKEKVAAVATDEVAPLSFEALNFYHIRDGKPAQDYTWLRDVKLIEPHRETTLLVSSPRDGYDYIWEVHAGETDEGDLIATASGAEAVVTLTVLDDSMITVKEVLPDGEIVRQLDEMVMVKYVRREIRTLTDEERVELLDAMHQIWTVRVSGGNGIELFGDGYADISSINRLHFKAAQNKSCDHFHDGLGFLTSHSMLTNTFEYSLQRVNPKLTVPYWDFTIEYHEAEIAGDDNEMTINSPLFQESWFGTADPVDNVVKDGRWANTEIPAMDPSSPGELIPDVYGLLRSRWTINSSPYLTRGLGKLCDGSVVDTYGWPSCEEHHNLVMDYDDFYSWVSKSMYSPHGPVHTWIGGVLNCEDTISSVSSLVGEKNANSLSLKTFDQRKNLWRDGFFECEGSAAVGTPADELLSSGKCGCLGYDLSQGDDWKTIYTNSTVDFDDVIGDYDDETKRQVVAAVCASTIFDGDHLHAGSSLDPTFWAMHPTMERLFMFSSLTGQLTDFHWPDSEFSYTDSDGNIVVETTGIYGDTCHGHGGSDVFPFDLLDGDDDAFQIKTGMPGNGETGNKLTNREVLAVLDARFNMLPYVYDNFRWDHCLKDGIDFEDAWDASTSSSADNKG
ncbi:ortho-aminophenol oxidase [Ectocarpus siliculosus]|uniref:Ortho-aminophenol oxidase n=1 Tax=Ectocarpus siliculosus TaxID=2880 RepID=D7FW00_ECTSI|nr:ortho-aminophenol oxidase [Ectocarpus siliculosus]|eukprot:CBJ25520.1 ortho-aminophenol oxidase [Ectocarpus siliculosus]